MMMMNQDRSRKRRIAVTGAGLVSALGGDRREVWARIREGRCGIGPIRLLPDEDFPVRIGGEARLPAERADSPAGGWGGLRRSSRTDRMCLLAAREALEGAGYLGTAGAPSGKVHDFGVSVGSTTGGMLEGEEAVLRAVSGSKPRRLRAGALLSVPCSQPAARVAGWAGLTGPCLANTTACSSGALAIALAADAIRRGETPGMLAGGADSLCRLTLSGFGSLKLLDAEPCRPFDAERRGLSLGEGAGILLLEDWDRARERGAPILAEFLDYGMSCDAHHLTSADPGGQGAARAVRTALERSEREPGDVDYINAHGTGTPLNDASEVLALRAVFGALARRIPVSSTKSLFGHALGAAGGLEAVVTVMALETQILPPTAGWRGGDEGFDLDTVPGLARPARLRTALSNNFGFGGGNCTLAFAATEAP
jgi:3-oxoacyl-[acyl-carrier-protein] synthase II